MPIFVVLAAILVPASPPITVTGHSWAPFISPMGEPFRPKNASDDTLADWFNQADLNHDGYLTQDEMVADAVRFFATLDTDHDGSIDPDEVAHYEWEIAPDIQVMSRTRRAAGEAVADPRSFNSEGGSSDRKRKRESESEEASTLGFGDALQGAARYGILNIPEPVAAADMNFDRKITLEEFKEAAIERFQLLDSAHQGRVTLAQLEALRPTLPKDGKYPKLKIKGADKRIANPVPAGP